MHGRCSLFTTFTHSLVVGSIADYVFGDDEHAFSEVFSTDTSANYTFDIRSPVSVLAGSSALLPLYSTMLESASVAVHVTGAGVCSSGKRDGGHEPLHNLYCFPLPALPAIVLRNSLPHLLDMGSVAVSEDGAFVGEAVLLPLRSGESTLPTHAALREERSRPTRAPRVPALQASGASSTTPRTRASPSLRSQSR